MTNLASNQGKLTRLLYSVKSLTELNPKSAGGRELLTSFNRLRNQVRTLLPQYLIDEFDDLHPEAPIPSERRSLSAEALMGASEVTADAQQRLALLYGWLEGHLAFEQQQLKSE